MKTLGMDTGYRVVKGFGIVGDVAIRRLTVNLVWSMSFSIKTAPRLTYYTSIGLYHFLNSHTGIGVRVA